MAVRYVPYSGESVSVQWRTVLRAADRKGIWFDLNSGHRTFAQQKRLWDAYQRYLNGGPWAPLAAFPSCRAPHVRCGRPDHALDVNSRDGGEQRLQNWINSHRGVRVRGRASNTVPGEAWHLELPRLALAWLYFKYRRFR